MHIFFQAFWRHFQVPTWLERVRPKFKIENVWSLLLATWHPGDVSGWILEKKNYLPVVSGESGISSREWTLSIKSWKLNFATHVLNQKQNVHI